MKKLRIAQIAPLIERVPPKLYGGTERVVHWLTEKLVELGHEVTLFASGDSITNARLIGFSEQAVRLDKNIRDPIVLQLHMLSVIFKEYASQFDIIHSHLDYLGFPFAERSPVPVVHTTHGRLDLPEYIKMFRYYQHLHFVSISDAQRLPISEINWVATVYHGLPLDLYPYEPDPEDYFLYLGRLSEEKRPDIAIELAKKVGIKLKIAAKVDKADTEYYLQKIAPLMNHPNIEYLGEVNDKQKKHLIGKAKALLNTIDWPEPFGIVMIEALACGTPVITKRVGSTPEIITHRKTGFLCHSEEDFIEAIKNCDQISRQACREEFESRFTNEVMTRNYLKVYRRLLS